MIFKFTIGEAILIFHEKVSHAIPKTRALQIIFGSENVKTMFCNVYSGTLSYHHALYHAYIFFFLSSSYSYSVQDLTKCTSKCTFLIYYVVLFNECELTSFSINHLLNEQ